LTTNQLADLLSLVLEISTKGKSAQAINQHNADPERLTLILQAATTGALKVLVTPLVIIVYFSYFILDKELSDKVITSIVTSPTTRRYYKVILHNFYVHLYSPPNVQDGRRRRDASGGCSIQCFWGRTKRR
jgi:predicted PurR-regulated permease PerM